LVYCVKEKSGNPAHNNKSIPSVPADDRQAPEEGDRQNRSFGALGDRGTHLAATIRPVHLHAVSLLNKLCQNILISHPLIAQVDAIHTYL
jgi:hypothetical protein